MLSYFVNAKATKPEKTLSIEEVKHLLRKPPKELKETVELLRLETDEDEQTKMKRLLPAVTFSGEFTARRADALKKHSGLYVYDLDHVKPGRMRKLLSGHKNVVLGFASPRGEGFKVVLKGPLATNSAQHKAAWNSGASLVENLVQERIDRSGSDACRLCFLSHDPNMIIGKGEEFKSADGEHDGDANDDIMRGVPEPKADFSNYTSNMVMEMLWAVGSDIPYDRWRNIIWAVVSRFGRDEWVRDLLIKWSNTLGGKRAIGDDDKAFDQVFTAKGKGITLATLVQEARRAGWIDWRKLLRRDEDGELIHNEANLRIILENHPDFKQRFWMDSITETMLMTKKDNTLLCHISKDGGLIEEPIAFDVLCDIQDQLGIGFRGPKLILGAMIAIASKNKRNLRAEWLENLEWDGVPRLHRLFIDGFGAEDLERNEALAVSFLAGSAARILKPGVSVQVVPILMGQQGCGKSSGLAALCPERSWFCDSFIDFESKAGYEVVLTSAIVELSELSAMKKADIEKIKQFVTQQSVRFRAPYERQTRDHAASWVFIGTTNEDEFLKDTTGNRRFAPIKIVRAKVDEVVKWVEERRLQLWAEAVVLAKKGLKKGVDSWGVPKKFWDELAVAAENAREKDPWEDKLKEYGDTLIRRHGCGRKSLNEVAIESGVMVRSRIDEMHLAKLLKHLGWERKVVRSGEKTERKWILQPVGD